MDKILKIGYFWQFFKIALIIIGSILFLIFMLFIVSKVLSDKYYRDIK
jgi:hypothetical protein